MRPKFITAMAAYAVIAIMAGFTLDGKMRLFVWIFMAALAIKTYIADRAHWTE